MMDSTHYYMDLIAPENQTMVSPPQTVLSLAESLSWEGMVRDGSHTVCIAQHQSNARRKRKILISVWLF